MAQFTAGDTCTIEIDGARLNIKIEDASKSDTISARVESVSSGSYQVGTVYEFDRNAIR